MANFWVCAADSTGARIVGAEELLTPGPADLVWPDTKPGVVLETSGGGVVWQSAPNDPRQRSWVWLNMPSYRPDILRLIGRLEGLVASTRRGQNKTPWCYIKDGVTDKLRRIVTSSGTATASTTTTLTDSAQAWTANALSGGHGVIEFTSGALAGIRTSITANTATQVTFQNTQASAPAVGTSYVVQYSSEDWVRVRVQSVIKQIRRKSGSPTYDSVSLNFVIDDPSNWSVSDF